MPNSPCVGSVASFPDPHSASRHLQYGTASDGKLGEGPVLQATGSWARARYCKQREAGRGPGTASNGKLGEGPVLQVTGSWARAWEQGYW